MDIIEKIIIVHPTITTWGGRKKLEKQDLGKDFSYPETFIRLGNKQIVPRDCLQPFDTFRKQFKSCMSQYGVQLIGGFAFAEEIIGKVQTKLQEFDDKFKALEQNFIEDFEANVTAQITAYPEWAESIREAADEIRPRLAEKFGFSWKAYKVVPPGDNLENSDQDLKGLQDAFISGEDFQEKALEEIARAADKLLVRVCTAAEIKPVTLRSLTSIRNKLMNLNSLDAKLFTGAVRIIDLTANEMPKSGVIANTERQKLICLLILLRDLANVDIRQKMLNGEFDTPDQLLQLGFADDKPGSDDEGEAPESEDEDSVEVESEADSRGSNFVVCW